MGIWSRMSESAVRLAAAASVRARRFMGNQEGQGTTEYAILVGVLVVIAIVAIVVFRPKLQELWDAIATNMATL